VINMNKKKQKFINDLEKYLTKDLLSPTIYSILNNAIEMIKDGRFEIEEAKEYIIEWFIKLERSDYQLTSIDKEVYTIVKPKENNGVLSSLAYSISRAFRF
jgi:hypothetical protein